MSEHTFPVGTPVINTTRTRCGVVVEPPAGGSVRGLVWPLAVDRLRRHHQLLTGPELDRVASLSETILLLDAQIKALRAIKDERKAKAKLRRLGMERRSLQRQRAVLLRAPAPQWAEGVSHG